MQATSAGNARPDAISMVRCSPTRAISMPDGSAPTIWPRPIMPATTAAVAAEAPSPMADSTITGATAPRPVEYAAEGR
jgi:hypothetical protein